MLYGDGHSVHRSVQTLYQSFTDKITIGELIFGQSRHQMADILSVPTTTDSGTPKRVSTEYIGTSACHPMRQKN